MSQNICIWRPLWIHAQCSKNIFSEQNPFFVFLLIWTELNDRRKADSTFKNLSKFTKSKFTSWNMVKLVCWPSSMKDLGALLTSDPLQFIFQFIFFCLSSSLLVSLKPNRTYIVYIVFLIIFWISLNTCLSYIWGWN